MSYENSPGFVVVLLTLAGSSTVSLLREREAVTMEQLLISPSKNYLLMLVKIVPFSLTGLGELVVTVAFAKNWYHLPMIGNVPLFVLSTIICLFTKLGVGPLISVSAHTRQQALFMNWFVMMLVLLMPGFRFFIENMQSSLNT
ncbi:MAG: ABC transporter permease subunit [Syntrophales bacterium]|nr:ABC transporter permease subunit [Syntrophales bacterium]